MSEADSKSVTVHPYGPTLAYLESHISGNSEEYFDTLHQWVGLALDNPQHEREYDWEQYYPIGDDDDRSPIPKHRWKDISDEEKVYYELRKVSHGKSEFTKRIIENTDEEKRLHVSIRIATLVRMGVFRLIEQDEEGEVIQRIIVPKWTRDWHNARHSGDPTEKSDQSFARDCVKAMWFIGDEWELIYSMRDMLNSVLKTKFESKTEIWNRMQKRYSYRLEKKESQRVGSVLKMLLRAGLLEEKNGKYRNIDKQEFFVNHLEINGVQYIKQKKSIEIFLTVLNDTSMKCKIITCRKRFSVLGQLLRSCGKPYIENRSKTRTNTKTFNDAMCRIQEAGKRQQSHVYQDAKSRKRMSTI